MMVGCAEGVAPGRGVTVGVVETVAVGRPIGDVAVTAGKGVPDPVAPGTGVPEELPGVAVPPLTGFEPPSR